MTLLDHSSPVIRIERPGSMGQQPVLIPKNEVFRIRNIFEDHEYSIPSQYVASGSLTIVDIGANVGLFALYMKNFRLDSDIYCFEPVPQTLTLLQKNLETQHRITIYPYALSDYCGTARINLNAANFGENSLKFEMDNICQTAAVQVMDAATAFGQIGLSYIDILKIDTEGCEVEILESLQLYLPYVGILMVEYHSEKDRRRIDDLVQGHTLFDAKIYKAQLGLGTVKYINSRLL
jgi:FkbM family methyltransferase